MTVASPRGERLCRCSPRTQAYTIILVITINVIFVVNSVPWLIISASPSWQRSNDSTEKPLRTLRYDGVLTSHTDGVFPLLTDNQQNLADKFDAEAYVEKLIGQIYTEIVSDRSPGMRCCKDGRKRSRSTYPLQIDREKSSRSKQTVTSLAFYGTRSDHISLRKTV